MFKKILKVLGIAFIVLVVLVFLASIALIRESAKLGAPGVAPTGFMAERGFSSIEEELYLKETTDEIVSEVPFRLVIMTGRIDMVVKDVKESLDKMTQYTQEKDGWVVSSSIFEREGIPVGEISVRVPSEIFDEAIAYFRGLAEKVSRESIRGQDVTEEYTDLQSRLRNLEASEEQFLKIMEKAGTISEVLNVQREIGSVRDQIERTKGRIQYLEQLGKFSSITVALALSEEVLPVPPAEKWRPGYVFQTAWQSALGTLRGVSYLLIWVLTYAVVWVPLGIVVWWLARRFRSEKKN